MQLSCLLLLLLATAALAAPTVLRSTLHYYASIGDATKVRAMLLTGAIVNVLDEQGRSPRELALANGHAAVVELIDGRGCVCADRCVEAVLDEAAVCVGFEGAVPQAVGQCMLASPPVAWTRGMFVVQRAVMALGTCLVRWTETKPPPLSYRQVLYACISRTMRKGDMPADMTDDQGYTLLHRAVLDGDDALFAAVEASGVAVTNTYSCSDGATPLDDAWARNNTALAERLVRMGAKPRPQINKST